MQPNSYLVIVQNLTDFQALFPDVSPVIGNFEFGLAGGGELIRLFNSNDVLVDFVEYDDEDLWSIEPDGNGPTLELISPNLDNNLASSWSASIPPNGVHGTLGEIISTILQVGVCLFIPLIVYWFQKRSLKGFIYSLGIHASSKKGILLGLGFTVLLLLPILILYNISIELQQIMVDANTVTGKIKGLGLSANTLFILILAAVFQTAFAEEILFRGFIAKRLIAWLGFRVGNFIQAVLFGALHLILFLSILDSTPFLFIIVLVITSIWAYIIVIVNERYSGGSILPGWISHAASNIIAYSYIAFIA